LSSASRLNFTKGSGKGGPGEGAIGCEVKGHQVFFRGRIINMPSVVTSGSRTASQASRSSRRFLKSVRTVCASCAGDGLRVVAGKSGEAFEGVGQAGPGRGAGLL